MSSSWPATTAWHFVACATGRPCNWYQVHFFMRCLSTDSSKPPCWCWVMLSDNCAPVPARAWLHSFDDHVNMETTKNGSPELQTFKTKPRKMSERWKSEHALLWVSASTIQYAQLPTDGDSFIHQTGKYKHSNCNKNSYSNKRCLMLTAIFSKYKTCITTNITTLQSKFVSNTIKPVLAVMFIFICHFSGTRRTWKEWG